LAGAFIRVSALVLGVLLLLIVINLLTASLMQTAARDFGLMVVTFSAVLRGRDRFSVDSWRRRRS
jgi:uncharacterized membrane protein YphA (DoxX/SURF4 family)